MYALFFIALLLIPYIFFELSLKKVKRTKKIIKMWEHESWGNNIFFNNWNNRDVVGWMPVIPEVGDILLCKMASGKVRSFEFVAIKKCYDPKDMFFAKV